MHRRDQLPRVVDLVREVDRFRCVDDRRQMHFVRVQPQAESNNAHRPPVTAAERDLHGRVLMLLPAQRSSELRQRQPEQR